METYKEISITAAWGSGIGLTLMFVLDCPCWALIACPFMCTAITGCLYKTEEVFRAIASAWNMMKNMHFSGAANVCQGIVTVLSWIGHVIIGLVFGGAPLFFFLFLYAPRFPQESETLFAAIVGGVTVGALFFLGGTLLGQGSEDFKKTALKEKRWTFPLSRRMPSVISNMLSEITDVETPFKSGNGMQRIFTSTMKIWVIQMTAIPIMLFLLFDTFLTIVIACATTDRLASMVGSFLGGLCGVVSHLVCAPVAPILIVGLGMLTGGYSGPVLYRLSLFLAEPAGGRKETEIVIY